MKTRSKVAYSFLFLITTLAAFADPPTQPTGLSATKPQLKRSTQIIDSIGHATVVSPDGQVASVIFDNLVIGTHESRKLPLVVTRTAVLTVPITGNDNPVKIRHDIRGFVTTRPESHAALVIQTCGQATVVDLPKAIDTAKNPATPARKEKRERPVGLEVSDDFFVSIEGTLPARASHYVTFFLLVEKDRDDPDLGAALHVDSVDIVLSPADSGKR
jgi:hypothetical protein